MLDAVVVAGQGGRAQQVDGAVRADQSAAGQSRRGDGEGEGEGCKGSGEATHGSGPLSVARRTDPLPREFPAPLSGP